MAHQRTWKLHLNLDEFNAAYAALDDEPEKAQFLKGLSRGMNAGIARPESTDAFHEGFDLGHRMRQEAEAFRNHQSLCGAKGGNPNLKTQGSVKGALRVGEGCLNPNPQSLILNPLINNPESVLPPTPSASAEGMVGKKGVRARRTKQEALTMFSTELSDLVNNIAKITPKEQPTGKPIRLDVAKLAARLDNLRKEATSEFTDDILLAAWRDYLASKPMLFKAPQYFFGEQKDNGEGANYSEWARLAYHKLQKEKMKQAVEA